MSELPPRVLALAEALAAELAAHVVTLTRDELLRAQAAPEPWLTPDQVAQLANVGVSTVLDWIRSGKLRHGRASGKVVRVRASDLDAFLCAGAESESATGEPEERAAAAVRHLAERRRA